MTTPTQAATDMYAKLKPSAVQAAHDYVMNRTPAELQTIMAGLIQTDLNPPPDPTIADVHDGAILPVVLWDASTVNGTAHVAGGSVTNVTMPVVPTKAIIANGAPVVVHNLADAVQPGSPAGATVAGGALTKVNLTV